MLFFFTAFLTFILEAVFGARLCAAPLFFFLAIAVAISPPVMGSLDSEGDSSTLNFSIMDFFDIILYPYEMSSLPTPAERDAPESFTSLVLADGSEIGTFAGRGGRRPKHTS